MTDYCDPPVPGARGDARTRILAAARELAAERGPGNISFEAVAARAGLSKGGVLYHFNTKANLLSAVVASHVETTQERIARHMPADGPNLLARALIASWQDECEEPTPPPSGILTVLAEHPDFLDPVRDHLQATLDKLRQDSTDPDLASIVFLALEGMRALSLFGFDLLDGATEQRLMDRMTALLLDADAARPANAP